MESEIKTEKVKAMEDWLMKKRLNEAQKIAKLRNIDDREEIHKEIRESTNFKSYK